MLSFFCFDVHAVSDCKNCCTVARITKNVKNIKTDVIVGDKQQKTDGQEKKFSLESELNFMPFIKQKKMSTSTKHKI